MVSLEHKEKSEPKDKVELEDPLVQWDHKDSKDLRVFPAPEETLDQRVFQASLVMLELKDVKEIRDHQDLLEHLVLKDLKEAWE